MPAIPKPSGYPPMIGICLTQAEWLDYLTTVMPPVRPRPTKIVLHHTWSPRIDQWHGLATMRGMQRYYRGLGWSAAPHIYVAPDGIWLFTPLTSVGVHAGTNNGSVKQGWYSIGVEMVGDYDKERPGGIVWDNTLCVLSSLADWMGKPFAEAMAFHRDTSPKTCPGSAITKEWVLSEVAAWVKHRKPTLGTYTDESPIMGMAPVGEHIIKRNFFERIAKSPHYPDAESQNIIFNAYVRECGGGGVDLIIALAQLCHETGNLSSFWCDRERRNPAGIGVTGVKQFDRPLSTHNWSFNPNSGMWEAGVSFATWDKDAVPAHVGRLLAYAIRPVDRTVDQGQRVAKALEYRDLPTNIQGSAPILRLLGARNNPTKNGWASPGDDYGARLAKIANVLVQA